MLDACIHRGGVVVGARHTLKLPNSVDPIVTADAWQLDQVDIHGAITIGRWFDVESAGRAITVMDEDGATSFDRFEVVVAQMW